MQIQPEHLTAEWMQSQVQLGPLKSHIFGPDQAEFEGPPGREHYWLLAYLSTLVNHSTLIDLGTHRGRSALSLSYNETNVVHTFDIEDRIPAEFKQKPNIRYRLENIFDNLEAYKELLLQSPLIFLDIDPHEGPMEYQLYEFLRDNHYTGLLVCDDVWHFKGMRNHFWYQIPAEYRYDVTAVGHWSGTAIISFRTLPLPNMSLMDTGYTLVTAYFNLAKCPDASAQIKERNQEYYLSHAHSTLTLPCSLVVFCDAESYDQLYAIRPDWLRSKTHYVIREFDDFPNFGMLRNKIIENRTVVHPYHFDPRNTASYYLFCMSRYWMLRETIESNPFNSSHFAWINVCIERMGIPNVRYLKEALSVRRDRFSTCYIDYVPPTLVNNTKEYFQFGRCGMCSGFFTGNAQNMFAVCGFILDKFAQYVQEGFGHADEQLYSPVYFEHPDLFEHYYGDYAQMITNYVRIRENAEAPVHNFISHAFAHGNYAKCLEACEFVIQSLKERTCHLNEEYLKKLGHVYLMCKLRANK